MNNNSSKAVALKSIWYLRISPIIANSKIPHNHASEMLMWGNAIIDENERLRNLLKKCRPYIKDESDWGYDGEMNLLAEIDKATGEVK